jgi:hypothetical protein
MLMCVKVVLGVIATAALLGPTAVAGNQYAGKLALEARVAKLEQGMRARRAELRESRRQERLLLNSMTDALVSSGQAKLAAAQLHAELECIRQLPVVAEPSFRAAAPSDLIDCRLAVIDNRVPELGAGTLTRPPRRFALSSTTGARPA